MFKFNKISLGIMYMVFKLKIKMNKIVIQAI